jgi:hypothetical protein
MTNDAVAADSVCHLRQKIADAPVVAQIAPPGFGWLNSKGM